MGHEGQALLIKDILVFLFAAGIVVPLFRLLRLPTVVGFVAAGVALGPNGLGLLAAHWPVLELFTISDPQAAALFAELGILFLLFMLGLEFSFEKLWALRQVVFGAGGLQAGMSAAIIGITAYFLGLTAPAAAIVGLALALSSTAVVMQVLTEKRRAAAPVGRAALGVLLFQDLMVAPILIFVDFASQDAQFSLATIIAEALIDGFLAILAIFIIGRFLLRRVFRLAAHAGGRDFLMALTLFTVVGAAVITASAGLSLALGAFLAGLLLGETEFKHQTEVDLEPFKGLLLGLFFMTVGMSFDLEIIGRLLPWVASGLLALLIVKAVIAAIACRLFAGGASLAIETAFLLAPAGEFAFIILATAVAGGVLGGEAAALVAAIAGLSMALIPLLGQLGRITAARFAKARQEAGLMDDFAGLKGHVIVAGFGRVGHAIARILETEEAEVVALERNPICVAKAREEGWRAYLGDAARPEILARAGAQGAAMFIITVDDADSAEAMVRAVRNLRRDALILVRARDADHARRLSEAGAGFVIPDAIEAGLQLAARALEEFGYEGESVRDRIAAERAAAYRATSTE